MNEIFGFFLRNSKWFVFVFYMVLSCTMLFRDDPYRRHVWLTSANRVSSEVYSVSNNINQYFDLRKINKDLNRRNATLEAEVMSLRQRLQTMAESSYTDTLELDPEIKPFDFIVATVINNSVARPFNYLTVNKGRAEGIRPELGVIDQNGVVGIVSVVGEHSSRVISLLNPNLRISCKIKESDNFGSLVWDGEDPNIAVLEELPRHTVYELGDTIVTSGYSSVFPSGLPVGVIIDDSDNRSQNFFSLRIRLFSDFTKLSNVQIVVSNLKEQLDELEKSDASKNNPTF